jgi:predicted dehydrogenase
VSESTAPRRIGIALIGTGFMGGLHARAFNTLRNVSRQPKALPDLRVVADVREQDARAAAERWGFASATGDWRSVLSDPEVEVVDICTPPALHQEIATAAAEAGKHVYCEKPVGRNRAETEAIWQAIQRAGVRSFVGFNYRWSPAVQYARELSRSGRLGELRLVRISFRTDMAADAGGAYRWRYSAEQAGFGALSDLGSHVFDMARNLVGEIVEVCGRTMRSVEARPDLEQGGAIRAVDNDDSFQALVTFSNGADGVLEGSRVATGYKGDFRFELIGSEGSLSWTMQRVNELELYTTDGDPRERGFTLIRTGPDHPPFEMFLPSPLGLGYAETKVIEARAFLDALADGVVARPTIEDAVIVARLLEAVPRRTWVQLEA